MYLYSSIYKRVEDAVTWRCLGFFGVSIFRFSGGGGGGWAGNLRVLRGGDLQYSSSPKCFTALVCAFCAPWLAILLCKDLRTETNILQVGGERILRFHFHSHFPFHRVYALPLGDLNLYLVLFSTVRVASYQS